MVNSNNQNYPLAAPERTPNQGGGGYISRIAPGVVFPVRFPEPRIIMAEFAAAAAGDYAANDIVSQNVTDTLGLPLEVPFVVDRPGGVAVLDSINYKCSEDSVLWRLRIHWYDRIPLPAEVEMDDNIAADFAKTDIGLQKYLGYTDLPAAADRGTALAQAQATNLRQLLRCDPRSTSLYALVQTLDAETNETAAMSMHFDFGFLP